MMEIKLPPTLTARYEEAVWSGGRLDGALGAAVVEFGGYEVAEIPVFDQKRHDRLTAYGLGDDGECRESALSELVAGWLGARLLSVTS